MKLKTRLIIAFVTVIAFPILLGALFIFMLGQYQLSMIAVSYTHLDVYKRQLSGWQVRKRFRNLSLK